MAKKQAVNPTTAAGAAPARAVKASAPRTRTAKHSKASVVEIPVTEAQVVEAPIAETPATEAIQESQIVDVVPPAIVEDPMDRISRLAYGYWLDRGGQGGSALDDWSRAEKEYRRLYS